MAAPLSASANETLENILDRLDHRSLTQVARTCSRLTAPAQRAIYREVVLSTDLQFVRVIQTLLAKPHLLRVIRHLYILPAFGWHRSGYETKLSTAIWKRIQVEQARLDLTKLSGQQLSVLRVCNLDTNSTIFRHQHGPEDLDATTGMVKSVMQQGSLSRNTDAAQEIMAAVIFLSPNLKSITLVVYRGYMFQPDLEILDKRFGSLLSRPTAVPPPVTSIHITPAVHVKEGPPFGRLMVNFRNFWNIFSLPSLERISAAAVLPMTVSARPGRSEARPAFEGLTELHLRYSMMARTEWFLGLSTCTKLKRFSFREPDKRTWRSRWQNQPNQKLLNDALDKCAGTLESLSLDFGKYKSYRTDLGPERRLVCLPNLRHLMELEVDIWLLLGDVSTMIQFNTRGVSALQHLPRSLQVLNLKEHWMELNRNMDGHVVVPPNMDYNGNIKIVLDSLMSGNHPCLRYVQLILVIQSAAEVFKNYTPPGQSGQWGRFGCTFTANGDLGTLEGRRL